MKRSAQPAWKKCAESLAQVVPLSRLHPSVRAWAETKSRAASGPWALACSGGADSVALVLLLWAHWPERREKMLVLHYDHRLRGEESKADADFCRRLSRSLGLRFVSETWRRKEDSAISEAAAREARHAFFRETLARHRGKALWLGHQSDDVAENMLMRLARGSGTAGLAAPRPVHEQEQGLVHLRPLLGLRKKEICELLQQAGAPWREDSSNAGEAYFRNRIRKRVIPVWQAAAPERDALAGAVLSRDLLEEDDMALEQWLDELAPLKRGLKLELALLSGKPKALWRRALHRWLLATPYCGDLSRQGFNALLEAVMKGHAKRFSLGLHAYARIKSGVLYYEQKKE